MAGLCEGGNEPPGSLKASVSRIGVPNLDLNSFPIVVIFYCIRLGSTQYVITGTLKIEVTKILFLGLTLQMNYLPLVNVEENEGDHVAVYRRSALLTFSSVMCSRSVWFILKQYP
ncbi:hypothetical protein ANN_21532 [Periplaneta americana]|uniref:Uncharacterized protein n=1 Tax=Periplaneta americana TaxID=6978 RepID=A0ABQ8S6J6_PERAM|nr:hypothetical protein ANN_21532 [Periplaneta americana]